MSSSLVRDVLQILVRAVFASIRHRAFPPRTAGLAAAPSPLFSDSDLETEASPRSRPTPTATPTPRVAPTRLVLPG